MVGCIGPISCPHAQALYRHQRTLKRKPSLSVKQCRMRSSAFAPSVGAARMVNSGHNTNLGTKQRGNWLKSCEAERNLQLYSFIKLRTECTPEPAFIGRMHAHVCTCPVRRRTPPEWSASVSCVITGLCGYHPSLCCPLSLTAGHTLRCLGGKDGSLSSSWVWRSLPPGHKGRRLVTPRGLGACTGASTAGAASGKAPCTHTPPVPQSCGWSRSRRRRTCQANMTSRSRSCPSPGLHASKAQTSAHNQPESAVGVSALNSRAGVRVQAAVHTRGQVGRGGAHLSNYEARIESPEKGTKKQKQTSQ